MPLTLQEYQIGQLYSTMKFSKDETGGGEGMEWVFNEAFSANSEDALLINGQKMGGQYTEKIIFVADKVPGVVRTLAPKGSMEMQENSWNAYPHERTEISNPEYLKEAFSLSIKSVHLSDRGTTDNALNLDADVLSKREVEYIDIANDPVNPRDVDPETDPQTFKSVKTGRGELGEDWSKTVEPVMCCYKLVTCEFKWFGMQERIEKIISRYERRLFQMFNRKVFCWMDKWYGLKMEEIRQMEEETRLELYDLRTTTIIRGMSEQ